VLRAAGETETRQDNIRDWIKFDEGDPGFQLLTQKEIAAVIFLFIFISTAHIIKFSILFISFFLSFRANFRFINPDYPLILMIFSPQIIPD
jgi:hypothetical protein